MRENASKQSLIARIEELEAALLPFAEAAYGFEDGDITLEYLETDGDHVPLFQDGDPNRPPLMTQDLLDAAKLLNVKTT